MRQLVLAGLGHAHLFVLEALRKGALPECDVHVCTGEAEHVYSGMVPGWLAGRYRRDEIALDVARLCAAAGATWHPHHVRALSAGERTVTLDSGEPVPFDVASVAVGSVPAGTETAGVREHAVPLKPLGNVERIAERVSALRATSGASSGAGDAPAGVTVVGGGLAGVEIALAIKARGGRAVAVRMVTRDAVLASGRGAALSRRLASECQRAQVRVEYGGDVREVAGSFVRLADDRTMPSALTVWATGPAAPSWLSASGCTVDERGFLQVDDALRSVSHPFVFAAGDCATLASARATPKAGVYAVRMGPVLAKGLGAALQGHAPPDRFTPQSRWLALVNTGDGRALASYGPFVMGGAWAMRVKDAIDRRFVARFTV